MLNKIMDVALCVAIVIALIVAFDVPVKTTATEEPTEVVYEATTEPVTEETTEPIQETIETEPPTTEATEPPVTLFDVPLDADLQLHIISEAEAHNIDPAIIMAMAFQESTYRTDVIGDSGRSYGLLQVQLRFHKDRMQKLGCTDLLDPFQNVTVGIDFLCELLNRYGSIDKALVAYNAGSYKGTITSYSVDVLEKAEELKGDTYVLFR